MTSTYLSYTLDTKNMTSTLARVASQPTTKREVDYYNANIGKVKTVDDLMDNYQLYSYAMKSYGLEDFTYAKAFMKQVLTSDLSDSSSFANRLNDPKYKAIAAAFNFGASTATTAQSSDTLTTMFGSTSTSTSSDTTDAAIGLYQQSFTDEETAAKTASDAYDAAIGSVKNVDDFLSDTDLRDYVLKGYGIDPTNISNSFLKSMLTSDVSDPNSFVNVNGSAADKAMAAQFSFNADGSIATTTPDADKSYYEANIGTITSVDQLVSDPRLFDYVKTAYGIDPSLTGAKFVASVKDPATASDNGLTSVLTEFNFGSDGTVATGASAQTADQISTTSTNYAANYTSQIQTFSQKAAVMEAYNTTVPSFVTSVAAADDAAYYKAHIGSVTSVEELTSDTRLFDYVKIAYNLQSLDAQASDNTLKYDLETSVEDPTYAKLVGFSGVVAQFNFQSDGTVASGTVAQTSTQLAAATTAFSANYQSEQTTAEADAVANYETRIAKVKNINEFFASNATADSSTANDNLPELYQMALRSYGIGENEISKAQMKKIMESDPYDPKSYVNTLKDDRFVKLAKAFNFDSAGTIKPQVTALSTTQVNSYISEYSTETRRGLTGSALTAATATVKKDATYFTTNIAKVTSVSDLLADPKLTDFILKASGIDPKKVTTDTLKKAFASDPDNSKSFLNTTAGAQFKDIVEAFNFGTNGTMVDTKLGSAQNKGALDATNELYLHQTLESQEGDNNPGTRLALYFQRQAPNINSVYDIMSDTALYSVITTTFSLPSAISSMNVDDQAALLKKFVNVDDLRDPTKLNKLLERFSVEYDLQNNAGSTSSSALSILQGSSKSIGISADTLLSIAQLSTS
ncbi:MULTISPECIES: DUF1217 domain-containing protein [unclassified Rhizobium]|uniref:DUF1217 domain-containing protein n=1 Tax=unclassified Rhizobium TaxID=2613769 RepID=UPI00115C98AD|nr:MULTISPECIES: DUF1217 domain-containing protein [unclassified Rhizobium]TQX89999.1 DUF1217 domain-containing protein [Rhizobium sp. rho-13.1]TQY15950.1 DUF1217 domain-containing protein [Rhizobium sp. rho-1.1]